MAILFVFKEKEPETINIPDNIKVEFVEKAEFELNEKIVVEDLVKSIDNVAITKYPTIDTSVAGEYFLNFIGKSSSGIDYQFTKKIIVVDKLKPILELSETSIELENGVIIDYEKYIKAIDDNAGKDKVKLEIENKILDTSIAGEYTVNYIAKDNSGNDERKSVIFKIKEKIKEESTPKPDITTTVPERPQNTARLLPRIEPPSNVSNEKYFYARDYENNAHKSFEACKNYLNQVGYGGCEPFMNDTGNWEGTKWIQ